MQRKAVAIVLHEIYGINPHIESICQKLIDHQIAVQCPNLLGISRPFTYEQEAEAYSFFMENVGFKQAADRVKELVAQCRKRDERVFLIGFSIGATIAWLCNEEKGVTGIIGFYGSRIRDYVHMSPSCPVLLFFPQKEPSFKVREVIDALDAPRIRTIQYEAAHGFSDPFSSAYDQAAAENTFEEALIFIGRGMERNHAIHRIRN